jgi:hypothetical protein
MLNWTLIGWIFIGLAAVLLAVLSWGVRINTPSLRKNAFLTRYKASQAATVEQGKSQQIVLGNGLSSPAYPGLGLTALSAIPVLITPESLADGNQSIASGSGGLAALARQIVEGRYADSFTEQLLPSKTEADVYGLTPFSFTAGLLPELSRNTFGNLLYLGGYGPESVLAVNRASDRGGQVFAAAGSLTAQATLFLCVYDLLIGEEVFMIAPTLTGTRQSRAGLMVEDLLRVTLIVLLIAGAVLKMCGVL